ncbi:hypothetical protein BDQ17DRAFT_1351073 [Cyathus striatus]|nr:hypothetical protein BDQ17DRAFT_1351073 [Cyathus striatus]
MLPGQLNSQNPPPPLSSLQSALQMDPNLQLQQPQQGQHSASPTAQNPQKRRRKGDGNGDDSPSQSEPRRLRRSHEACARCRSKKIKCDSKHPRCTACATAGTVCHQEDRHRQTLTPRGYTERIELKLAQCEALLKRYVPGFSLDSLDEILVREGIDVNAITPAPPSPAFQIEGSSGRSYRPEAAPPPQQQPPKGYPQMYPPPMMHPYGPMMPYGHPPPGPYPLPMQPPPGTYNIHPAFQQPPPGTPYSMPPGVPPLAQTVSQRPVLPPAKGTDPNGNDLSNPESLAKNFGVLPSIIKDLNLAPDVNDKEDFTVGSSGLSSGRDRSIGESTLPRHASHWVPISVRRNSTASAPNTIALSAPVNNQTAVEVWLPKDRNMVDYIVDVYFTRLNIHRPTFARKTFQKSLNDLYEGRTIAHDPGFVCSVYLILALGTLSELNHRAVKADVENKGDMHLGSVMAKKLMSQDWPEHDEFFELALSIKPDLRVTISSLQALILLHWYLYTERQGRTLWRLVGSLVRLSIELGLHHDPTTQMSPSSQVDQTADQPLFTEEECQLRIRLWGIVLIHDRGTSILLGRPLAIAPTHLEDFSEHFEHSHPIAEIQADIINSLYAPKRQVGDTIMRNATRIIKSMLEFRRGLPERFRYYFGGTNEDGLTLLKLGISRILMLRALFSSKELSYEQRHKALIDAIITSHNMIIIHNQLIRFPDIAFFTSPIPLHIAAMVILYGHMSKCDILPRATSLEDLWLALDMLPRIRWRWERMDVNGGHPLIAKLAERVMQVSLQTITPPSHPHLLCEPDWDEDNTMSPITKSQQSTPTLSATYTPTSAVVYGPQPRPMGGPNGTAQTAGSTPPSKHLVDVPTGLFYPFFPEAQFPPGSSGAIQSSPSNGNPPQQDYSHILAAAAAAQEGTYGYQASQETFMNEDRRPQEPRTMSVWMQQQGQRNVFCIKFYLARVYMYLIFLLSS